MCIEFTFGEEGGVIFGGELPQVACMSSKSTEAPEALSIDPSLTSLTKGTNI